MGDEGHGLVAGEVGETVLGLGVDSTDDVVDSNMNIKIMFMPRGCNPFFLNKYFFALLFIVTRVGSPTFLLLLLTLLLIDINLASLTSLIFLKLFLLLYFRFRFSKLCLQTLSVGTTLGLSISIS